MDDETKEIIATQLQLEVEVAEIDLALFRLKMGDKNKCIIK